MKVKTDHYGGHAFPQCGMGFNDHGKYVESIEGGMSLRDWFAGMALIGLIIRPDTCIPECPISARAYELADAMLDRRKP